MTGIKPINISINYSQTIKKLASPGFFTTVRIVVGRLAWSMQKKIRSGR